MEDTHKGLIAWFARNSVAANLLMLIILLGGLLTASSIRKQFFPAIDINWIEFSAQYPGTAPQEVEEGITIKIEQALESVQGLKRVITYSNRNQASGYFQIEDGYDPQVVLDEVKSEIDSISTFPAGMESPKVERIKIRQEVMYLSLYGDLTQRQLKDLGEKIHNEIMQLPNVNISEYYSGLGYEISVEVSKDRLREFGLTFNDVAQAVRGYSRNMSAGQIKAENGYINLRVQNQAYVGYEFEDLPLLTLEDGTNLLLGDVATVNDGFEQGIQYSKFNGKNSVSLFIGASKNQSITDVADVLHQYVEKKQKTLPQGVTLEPWVDMTYYLQGRLDLMLDSMKSGAVLVFLMLALFLRVRLAFWVMMGLPVCFLGTLLFMPMAFIDVTVNVISLFAFILVLGIVVDDAIVMGESAHSESQEHGQNIDSVIRGVKRVAMPATFGVLTTIAAFLPITLDEGPSSAFGQAIGYVVILCLLFSLIESKLILPSHLAHMNSPKVVQPGSKNPLDWLRNIVNYIQGKVDTGLHWFINHIYRPSLVLATTYRYAIIMLFLSFILICAGLYAGGLVRFIGQPKIPHDFPRVNVEMNVDASESATLKAALAIEAALYKVDKDLVAEYGHGMIAQMQVDLRGRTNAEIMAKLVDPEHRPLNTFEVADLWRQAIPKIPGVKSFTIQDSLFGGGRDDGDISFRLEGLNEQQLLQASLALKAKLNTLKGVSDVNDSRQSSAKEVQFHLKPLAHSLGLTLANIASQVGNSFYGLEAQRIIRNGEEVKVMLRYPEEQRNSIALVQDVLIKISEGAELPLSEVAEISVVQGVNSIRRENSNRTINVWASVDSEQAEPFKLAEDIRDNFIPQLLAKYPTVKSEVSGSIQEQIDSANTQVRDFIISMLVIYSLLAIPLRSYVQPFMIMSVIPFGIIGSMLGHLILGIDLSALSVFGIIAAAGVVVNDSLVMVDYINHSRKKGVPMKEAVLNAGCRRFRAILLTSLTTFIGLMPIMTETSMQAQMVIPMAVSLAFGVLFATVVTLCLIPCLYLAIEDMKLLTSKVIGLYTPDKLTQTPAHSSQATPEAR
ncbi:efflux RND transporter permease subunit [Shewanella intestini]|uniref:Efflux RND transporter permease subunit n=1 Tax=Shewanella intestini TaxID=2017544 RepID=A0ABS5I044_9GAMM|nr:MULTISPECIES: efflux RND transporter permease subunit [Shewanella]MBR9727203.1 efflux RND transporter permease subunit [Shewanella intestini]MRG36005.1 acriflavin resistance protein [Shewanella sp. XMDDZSB0408]